ncbi:MAG TPA: DUF1736 domain-containing protein [Victivallales bacterium]|nr:DUF1736 domain-containing protein [Victivallales bacterium]
MQVIPYIRKRTDLFAALFVFAAAFSFYINAIDGEFVFDDLPLISSDPFYHEGTSSTISDCFFRTYWRKEHSQGLYRPLTLASYLVNAKFAGLYSPSFRLTNILLHSLISVLVYVLCLKLLKNRKAAFISSILFAVHPIHSEAVIPGSGRADLLCSVFIFAGLLFHFSQIRLKSFVVFISCLSALLCKENGIVLLPLCVAYDFFFRNSEFRENIIMKKYKLLLEYLSYLLAVVIYFMMRIFFVSAPFPYFSQSSLFSDNQLAFLGFWERLPSAIWLQSLAVWQFIFPAKLSHDYSFAQILPITKIGDPRLVWTAIFISIVGILAVSFYRNDRKLSLFCICSYGLSILPVSNIITPTGTIFGERLYYFPSVWLCIIIISEMSQIVNRFKIRPVIITILSVMILLSLFIRLSLRIPDWKDLFSIASAGVKSSPSSHKMWNNYGLQLLDRGMLEEAETAFSRAIEINQANLQALRNRAYIRISKGNNQEALTDLLACIDLGTKDVEVYNKAGAIFAISGDKEKAASLWKKSLQINPNQRKIIEHLKDVEENILRNQKPR